MLYFEELQLENDILKGTYSSSTSGNITVQFDLEEETAGWDDLTGLVKEAGIWIQTRTVDALKELKRKIAVELTDSA